MSENSGRKIHGMQILGKKCPKPLVHLARLCLACVASEGEGKVKDEHRKRRRIAVGDACKGAIVFFIPPSN